MENLVQKGRDGKYISEVTFYQTLKSQRQTEKDSLSQGMCKNIYGRIIHHSSNWGQPKCPLCSVYI